VETYPLFAGEQRLHASGYASFLVYGAVVAIVLAGANAIHSHAGLFTFVKLGAAAGVLLLLGFRTDPLIAVGTLVVQARMEGHLRLGIRKLLLGFAGLFLMSWLAVYRFGAGPTAFLTQLRRLGMSDAFAPWAPVWVTAREGVGVLNILATEVPSRAPYQHGHVLLSAFGSMLPGAQLGPRLIVAQFIKGRPGVTITPSLLGEPYLDFGMLGVIAFMALLGFVLWSLYRWQQKALTWAPQLAYSFILTVLLLDIHAGLLDLSIFCSSGFLLWFAFRAERKARLSSGEQLGRWPVPSVPGAIR
jgi:hypothetical protein